VLSLLGMVFRGDEELNMFPRILHTGFLNETTKKNPFILMKTEFSSSAGPGGNLTS
jgi:hypothetical protein